MTSSDGSAVSKVSQGLTDCERGKHDWVSWRVDERKPCRLCGLVGRGSRAKDGSILEGGFFEQQTAARSELFSNLRTPASIKGTKK